MAKEGEVWLEKPQNHPEEEVPSNGDQDNAMKPENGFVKVTTEATFTEEIRIREGWLKLRWHSSKS